jgi:hypothetical protein
MATKVYKYGCKKPDYETCNAIGDQLYLAHRYRLVLWHISKASRELYRQRRRETFPQIAEMEKELEKLSELFSMLDTDSAEMRAERKRIKTAIANMRAELRRTKNEVKEDAAFQAILSQDQEREKLLRKAARGCISSLGLYSGTYQLIEEADKQSRKGKEDPKRPIFDGTGCLGIQIRNFPLARVYEPNPWVQVIPGNLEGGRRMRMRGNVLYRLRSEDRKPVLINLKTMISRPLPADAQIAWCKLKVDRIANRKLYSVQFTITSDALDRTEFGCGDVVICLDNDRIIYADKDAINNPKEFVHKVDLTRVFELQQTRDRLRNEMIKRLHAWCEDQDEIPEWFLDTLDSNTANRSSRRLMQFFENWKANLDKSQEAKEKFLANMSSNDKPLNPQRLKRIAATFESSNMPNSKEMLDKMRKWVYHENHLYEWQENMRDNLLKTRKLAYLTFARQLRLKYRNVILDDRKLELPTQKDVDANSAAFCSFRLAIRNSFGANCVFEASGNTPFQMLEDYTTRIRENSKA